MVSIKLPWLSRRLGVSLTLLLVLGCGSSQSPVGGGASGKRLQVQDDSVNKVADEVLNPKGGTGQGGGIGRGGGGGMGEGGGKREHRDDGNSPKVYQTTDKTPSGKPASK